jgi:hypothetical protein
VAIVNPPKLQDEGAWRRLAAARRDKGSGITGAPLLFVLRMDRPPVIHARSPLSQRSDSIHDKPRRMT